MSPLKKGELLGKETARLIPMNRDGQVETLEKVIVYSAAPVITTIRQKKPDM